MAEHATDALVIGGGPAGLMAADMLSSAGLRVVIADAMPSVARKLLMAGKSGLNLTKAEPLPAYLANFGPQPAWFAQILAGFGPPEVIGWAEGLGQKTFAGSSARVFPEAMKASPLLRAWLARLDRQGAVLRTRWRWVGWQGDQSAFDTPEGPQRVRAGATVLAMGGASWPRLGSTGDWAGQFAGLCTDFAAANAGLCVPWSDHMTRHFGQPLKGVALRAGKTVSRGETILSETGIEGGGIYPLSPDLRRGAALVVDLLPDLDLPTIRDRLARPRGKATLSNHLRRVLGLDQVKIALLQEFARPLPDDLAPVLKALPIRHTGLRPLSEAISTAGGLRLDALTHDLMLKSRAGVFAAGEMLDWEAPTGGYLISASLATGRHAGLAAARYLAAGR